jgi:hypothetical protein
MLTLVASASCVPASEPADPAGAIGFVTEPTAATQGAPFLTDDGWTVRIEVLAVQLHVSASTSGGEGFTGGYSGDYAEYRFGASERTEIFGRGLDVGPASATVSLGGGYVGDDFGGDDRVETLGLAPEIVARFRRPTEVTRAALSYPTYSAGPSVVFVARAERAGRVVRVDFTIDASSYTTSGQPTITGDVRADAVTLAPLVVAGEALFTDDSSGRLAFDDFAAADGDGDGIVTGADVSATSTLRLGGSTTPPRQGLADELYERAGRLLVLR